jgi:hypothetical protein
LAAFSDHGKLLHFNLRNETANDDPDHFEQLSDIGKLRAFVNGVSYTRVVVNPGSGDEVVYSAEELESDLNF